MESAKRGLLLGAGLLLTIALITLAVIVYQTSNDATKAAQSNFSGLQTELNEQTFLVYDNTKVSGSQVVNALRKYSKTPEFGIQVITGKGSYWYYKDASNPDSLTTASGNISNVTNEASNAYINPSGKFNARIVRDSNQVIRAIVFTQE